VRVGLAGGPGQRARGAGVGAGMRDRAVRGNAGRATRGVSGAGGWARSVSIAGRGRRARPERGAAGEVCPREAAMLGRPVRRSGSEAGWAARGVWATHGMDRGWAQVAGWAAVGFGLVSGFYFLVFFLLSNSNSNKAI
jgi:hypothetical protein